MCKKTLSVCALLLLSMTLSYAGVMKEVKPLPVLIPFVAAEGLYSWPEVDGFHIGVIGVGKFVSKKDESGWGGRMAVGAIHPLTKLWAGSAEVGWAYYGYVDLNPAFEAGEFTQVQVTATGKAFDVNMDQYGFDVLAGILYMQPKYNLFFKAGALAQNLRLTVLVDPTELAGDNRTAGLAKRLPGTYKLATTLVNVLPEIKVGGEYYINKNWILVHFWTHL